MKVIFQKEALAYLALILSIIPAAFACFGILMIGLDSFSSMYSTDELMKMLFLTGISAGLAFLFISTAYGHFSKSNYKRG